MTEPIKPDCLTEDMLDYLDELRESGVTNMFGAGSFVADAFGLSRKEASAVLSYWMQTFGTRNKET
jgi:hypothetical protein